MSAASILAAFGLDLAPQTRIFMYFPIGLSVFGVFGSFTYYLPELFPTRLRGTGAGFCYNIGRVVAAARPVPGRRRSPAAAASTRSIRGDVGRSFIGTRPPLGRRDQGRPLP